MGKKEKASADDPGNKSRDRERAAGLARLIEKAKGEKRSYAEYARDANISAAAMTRIRNGDYVPTPKTMLKLTSESAKPQGGVTYDDLMLAAGYKVAESSIPYPPAEQKKTSRGVMDDPIRESLREIGIAARQYEQELIPQIYTGLVDNGIIFRKAVEEPEEFFALRPEPFMDMAVELIDQPIRSWGFEIEYVHDKRKQESIYTVYQFMAKALRVRPDEGKKLSIVINSRRVFEMAKRYEHALAYRGELSIILFEQETGKLADEFYLSNYYEGDQSREIYLVKKK